MTKNRIFFKDNPYPLGHEIKEFVWGGYLDEDGQLWFDLHLKTDNYYAEDLKHERDYEDSEPELDNDWNSKIVWGNYHACTMSSTFWGKGYSGIMIDAKSLKLNFANWPVTHLTADTLPPNTTFMPEDVEWDDMAMNIYLLGHDACANHQITIKQTGKNNFHINWAGKIALVYAGDDEFKYSFNANMNDVKFDGFDYPQTFSQAEVVEKFSKFIVNLDDFEFVDLNPKSNKREYKFALR